jgi:hypothetical protein
MDYFGFLFLRNIWFCAQTNQKLSNTEIPNNILNLQSVLIIEIKNSIWFDEKSLSLKIKQILSGNLSPISRFVFIFQSSRHKRSQKFSKREKEFQFISKHLKIWVQNQIWFLSYDELIILKLLKQAQTEKKIVYLTTIHIHNAII